MTLAPPFQTSRFARSCLLFFGISLLSLPAALASPKEEASQFFAEGLRLYSEKDYPGAADELEKSYQAREDQRTLFAWAQAERLSGQCEESKRLLTLYIAKGANAKQSRAAYELMEECSPSEALGPGSSLDIDAAPPPVEVSETDSSGSAGTEESSVQGSSLTTSDPTITRTRAASPPWYRDWMGLSLLVGGSAGLVLSGVTYAEALSLEDSGMADGVSYEEFLTLRDDAETHRSVSLISGIAGGVLVTGGVLYILMGDKERDPLAGPVALHIGEGTTQLRYSGRF